MKHAGYMRQFARNLISNALDGDEERTAKVFAALDAAGSFLPPEHSLPAPDLTRSATICTIGEVIADDFSIKMQQATITAEKVVDALEERNQLRRPHPFTAFQQKAAALKVSAPWSAAGGVIFGNDGGVQIGELLGADAEAIAEFAALCVNTCAGYKVTR